MTWLPTFTTLPVSGSTRQGMCTMKSQTGVSLGLSAGTTWCIGGTNRTSEPARARIHTLSVFDSETSAPVPVYVRKLSTGHPPVADSENIDHRLAMWRNDDAWGCACCARGVEYDRFVRRTRDRPTGLLPAGVEQSGRAESSRVARRSGPANATRVVARQPSVRCVSPGSVELTRDSGRAVQSWFSWSAGSSLDFPHLSTLRLHGQTHSAALDRYHAEAALPN